MKPSEGFASAVIRAAVRRSGKSAASVAATAGVSRSLMNDYLSSRRQPSIPQIDRIVRAAGEALVVKLGVPGAAALTSASSLAELADEMAPADDQIRWRLLQGFLHDYAVSTPEARLSLTAEEPASLDPQWDALLAGLAEHLRYSDDTVPPRWCRKPERYLADFWWPHARTPHARRAALVLTPVSLARRGVMVEEDFVQRKEAA